MGEETQLNVGNEKIGECRRKHSCSRMCSVVEEGGWTGGGGRGCGEGWRGEAGRGWGGGGRVERLEETAGGRREKGNAGVQPRSLGLCLALRCPKERAEGEVGVQPSVFRALAARSPLSLPFCPLSSPHSVVLYRSLWPLQSLRLFSDSGPQGAQGFAPFCSSRNVVQAAPPSPRKGPESPQRA